MCDTQDVTMVEHQRVLRELMAHIPVTHENGIAFYVK